MGSIPIKLRPGSSEGLMLDVEKEQKVGRVPVPGSIPTKEALGYFLSLSEIEIR